MHSLLIAATFTAYISTVVSGYSAGSDLFPEEGKVFYADLMSDDNYGRHYVKLGIGSNTEVDTDMKLWVSTTESELGVITIDGVVNCNVLTKYDYINAHPKGEIYKGQLTDVFNDTTMTYTKFEGVIWKDNVALTYDKTKQFTLKDIQVFGINNVSTENFTSAYSGYLGLAPFKSSPANKDKNFLWQLRNKGYIDYLAFALYTKEDKSAHSTIQFGGYDSNGLQKNEHLTVLRTVDDKSWAVWGEDIQIGDWFLSKKLKGNKRKVLIEPQMPYMHVPSDDFDAIWFVDIGSYFCQKLIEGNSR